MIQLIRVATPEKNRKIRSCNFLHQASLPKQVPDVVENSNKTFLFCGPLSPDVVAHPLVRQADQY